MMACIEESKKKKYVCVCFVNGIKQQRYSTYLLLQLKDLCKIKSQFSLSESHRKRKGEKSPTYPSKIPRNSQ